MSVKIRDDFQLWLLLQPLLLLVLFANTSHADSAHHDDFEPSRACILMGNFGCKMKCYTLCTFHHCKTYNASCENVYCNCHEVFHKHRYKPFVPTKNIKLPPKKLHFRTLLAQKFMRTPVHKKLYQEMVKKPALRRRVMLYLYNTKLAGKELKKDFKRQFPTIRHLVGRLRVRPLAQLKDEKSEQIEQFPVKVDTPAPSQADGGWSSWFGGGGTPTPKKPPEFDINSSDNKDRIINMIKDIPTKEDLLATFKTLKNSPQKPLYDDVAKYFTIKGLKLPDGTEILSPLENPRALNSKLRDNDIEKIIQDKINEKKPPTKNQSSSWWWPSSSTTADDDDDSSEKSVPAKNVPNNKQPFLNTEENPSSSGSQPLSHKEPEEQQTPPKSSWGSWWSSSPDSGTHDDRAATNQPIQPPTLPTTTLPTTDGKSIQPESPEKPKPSSWNWWGPPSHSDEQSVESEETQTPEPSTTATKPVEGGTPETPKPSAWSWWGTPSSDDSNAPQIPALVPSTSTNTVTDNKLTQHVPSDKPKPSSSDWWGTPSNSGEHPDTTLYDEPDSDEDHTSVPPLSAIGHNKIPANAVMPSGFDQSVPHSTVYSGELPDDNIRKLPISTSSVFGHNQIPEDKVTQHVPNSYSGRSLDDHAPESDLSPYSRQGHTNDNPQVPFRRKELRKIPHAMGTPNIENAMPTPRKLSTTGSTVQIPTRPMHNTQEANNPLITSVPLKRTKLRKIKIRPTNSKGAPSTTATSARSPKNSQNIIGNLPGTIGPTDFSVVDTGHTPLISGSALTPEINNLSPPQHSILPEPGNGNIYPTNAGYPLPASKGYAPQENSPENTYSTEYNDDTPTAQNPQAKSPTGGVFSTKPPTTILPQLFTDEDTSKDIQPTTGLPLRGLKKPLVSSGIVPTGDYPYPSSSTDNYKPSKGTPQTTIGDYDQSIADSNESLSNPSGYSTTTPLIGSLSRRLGKLPVSSGILPTGDYPYPSSSTDSYKPSKGTPKTTIGDYDQSTSGSNEDSSNPTVPGYSTTTSSSYPPAISDSTLTGLPKGTIFPSTATLSDSGPNDDSLSTLTPGRLSKPKSFSGLAPDTSARLPAPRGRTKSFANIAGPTTLSPVSAPSFARSKSLPEINSDKSGIKYLKSPTPTMLGSSLNSPTTGMLPNIPGMPSPTVSIPLGIPGMSSNIPSQARSQSSELDTSSMEVSSEELPDIPNTKSNLLPDTNAPPDAAILSQFNKIKKPIGEDHLEPVLPGTLVGSNLPSSSISPQPSNSIFSDGGSAPLPPMTKSKDLPKLLGTSLPSSIEDYSDESYEHASLQTTSMPITNDNIDDSVSHYGTPDSKSIFPGTTKYPILSNNALPVTREPQKTLLPNPNIGSISVSSNSPYIDQDSLTPTSSEEDTFDIDKPSSIYPGASLPKGAKINMGNPNVTPITTTSNPLMDNSVPNTIKSKFSPSDILQSLPSTSNENTFTGGPNTGLPTVSPINDFGDKMPIDNPTTPFDFSGEEAYEPYTSDSSTPTSLQPSSSPSPSTSATNQIIPMPSSLFGSDSGKTPTGNPTALSDLSSEEPYDHYPSDFSNPPSSLSRLSPNTSTPSTNPKIPMPSNLFGLGSSKTPTGNPTAPSDLSSEEPYDHYLSDFSTPASQVPMPLSSFGRVNDLPTDSSSSLPSTGNKSTRELPDTDDHTMSDVIQPILSSPNTALSRPDLNTSPSSSLKPVSNIDSAAPPSFVPNDLGNLFGSSEDNSAPTNSEDLSISATNAPVNLSQLPASSAILPNSYSPAGNTLPVISSDVIPIAKPLSSLDESQIGQPLMPSLNSYTTAPITSPEFANTSPTGTLSKPVPVIASVNLNPPTTGLNESLEPTSSEEENDTDYPVSKPITPKLYTSSRDIPSTDLLYPATSTGTPKLISNSDSGMPTIPTDILTSSTPITSTAEPNPSSVDVADESYTSPRDIPSIDLLNPATSAGTPKLIANSDSSIPIIPTNVLTGSAPITSTAGPNPPSVDVTGESQEPTSSPEVEDEYQPTSKPITHSSYTLPGDLPSPPIVPINNISSGNVPVSVSPLSGTSIPDNIPAFSSQPGITGHTNDLAIKSQPDANEVPPIPSNENLVPASSEKDENSEHSPTSSVSVSSKITVNPNADTTKPISPANTDQPGTTPSVSLSSPSTLKLKAKPLLPTINSEESPEFISSEEMENLNNLPLRLGSTSKSSMDNSNSTPILIPGDVTTPTLAAVKINPTTSTPTVYSNKFPEVTLPSNLVPNIDMQNTNSNLQPLTENIDTVPTSPFTNLAPNTDMQIPNSDFQPSALGIDTVSTSPSVSLADHPVVSIPLMDTENSNSGFTTSISPLTKPTMLGTTALPDNTIFSPTTETNDYLIPTSESTPTLLSIPNSESPLLSNVDKSPATLMTPGLGNYLISSAGTSDQPLLTTGSRQPLEELSLEYPISSPKLPFSPSPIPTTLSTPNMQNTRDLDNPLINNPELENVSNSGSSPQSTVYPISNIVPPAMEDTSPSSTPTIPDLSQISTPLSSPPSTTTTPSSTQLPSSPMGTQNIPLEGNESPDTDDSNYDLTSISKPVLLDSSQPSVGTPINLSPLQPNVSQIATAFDATPPPIGISNNSSPSLAYIPVNPTTLDSSMPPISSNLTPPELNTPLNPRVSDSSILSVATSYNLPPNPAALSSSISPIGTPNTIVPESLMASVATPNNITPSLSNLSLNPTAPDSPTLPVAISNTLSPSSVPSQPNSLINPIPQDTLLDDIMETSPNKTSTSPQSSAISPPENISSPEIETHLQSPPTSLSSTLPASTDINGSKPTTPSTVPPLISEKGNGNSNSLKPSPISAISPGSPSKPETPPTRPKFGSMEEDSYGDSGDINSDEFANLLSDSLELLSKPKKPTSPVANLNPSLTTPIDTGTVSLVTAPPGTISSKPESHDDLAEDFNDDINSNEFANELEDSDEFSFKPKSRTPKVPHTAPQNGISKPTNDEDNESDLGADTSADTPDADVNLRVNTQANLKPKLTSPEPPEVPDLVPIPQASPEDIPTSLSGADLNSKTPAFIMDSVPTPSSAPSLSANTLPSPIADNDTPTPLTEASPENYIQQPANEPDSLPSPTAPSQLPAPTSNTILPNADISLGNSENIPEESLTPTSPTLPKPTQPSKDFLPDDSSALPIPSLTSLEPLDQTNIFAPNNPDMSSVQLPPVVPAPSSESTPPFSQSENQTPTTPTLNTNPLPTTGSDKLPINDDTPSPPIQPQPAEPTNKVPLQEQDIFKSNDIPQELFSDEMLIPDDEPVPPVLPSRPSSLPDAAPTTPPAVPELPSAPTNAQSPSIENFFQNPEAILTNPSSTEPSSDTLTPGSSSPLSIPSPTTEHKQLPLVNEASSDSPIHSPSSSENPTSTDTTPSQTPTPVEHIPREKQSIFTSDEIPQDIFSDDVPDFTDDTPIPTSSRQPSYASNNFSSDAPSAPSVPSNPFSSSLPSNVVSPTPLSSYTNTSPPFSSPPVNYPTPSYPAQYSTTYSYPTYGNFNNNYPQTFQPSSIHYLQTYPQQYGNFQPPGSGYVPNSGYGNTNNSGGNSIVNWRQRLLQSRGQNPFSNYG